MDLFGYMNPRWRRVDAVLFVRMVLSALLVVCMAAGAYAAEKAAPAPAAKENLTAPATNDDPLGRSTPQGTVVGFLKAMERRDSERAVDYLNTSQSGKRAQQLVVELHQILDEGLRISSTALSSKPEGNLQDGLPVNREVMGTVKTGKGEHRIYLERIQRENNPPVWLFSADTLKRVPRIYEEIDIPWLEWHLPAVLTETRLAGQPPYRWIISLLMLPLSFLLGWIFTMLFFALVREPIRRRLDEKALAKIRRIRIPLMLLFSAAALYILSLGALSLLGRLFWTFLSATIAVAGLTWIATHLIETGADVIEKRRPATDHAFIRLTATLLKVFAVITGLVIVFYYFAGINLTAVVAGLGVGGIAVAFAAQKTIENFFGGVFLVWDKPIRLGDYCKAGEHQGTVEHIGLRSTQIRTLARTVVSIPNGQLAAVSIENFSLRDRFLFRHTLNLRYETTADQLRYLMTGIRELLYRHPRVDTATARVRFIAFGPSSIDVEIYAFILEKAQEAFLAVQEDLLLRIMDLVESAGSGFAFPSQTLYVTKDEGLDGGKGRAAAEAVQRWRDQGELPFPDHSPSKVSKLDGDLEYPPEGSVTGRK